MPDVWGLARERPDQLAGGVENLECHLLVLGQFLREGVVDHRAVRRVFSLRARRDVEAEALGGKHEVLVPDLEVRYGGHWQIQLQ